MAEKCQLNMGMTCPICGGGTRVVTTINKPKETVRYRRCADDKCGYRFPTLETRIDMTVGQQN